MFKSKKVLLLLCMFTVFSCASELSKKQKGQVYSSVIPIENKEEYLGIFHNIWGNTKDSFAGTNFYYHVGAFASTYAIAESGIDDTMYDWSLANHHGSGFGEVAFYTGAVIQPLVGSLLYFSDNPETKTAGAAVLQTMIVQSAYVGLLKGISGRPDPVLDGDIQNADPDGTTCGNSFNPRTYFDIGKGCSWPSGHTSSVVSLVSTLYAFYPEETWIAYIGYPLALGVGLGMVDNDEHWFSEIVAGALIGHVIGWTIGKNFRNDYNSLHSDKAPQKHFVSPKFSPHGGVGVGYTYKF